MLRREFLQCLASSAVLAEPSGRPNILVMLCDDLGYGDLECYGHPVIKTPNLNRLAEEGVKFTDFYAAAPVCSPSRTGMLTGRTPNRAGVYDWIPAGSPMHMPRSEVTIASLLRSAGYATCHVGKWHCNGKFNSPEQPQPNDHGFDHWFSTQNNAAPSHRDPTNFVRNGQRVGPLKGFSSDIIVDEAISWLDRYPKDRPFCLFVWFHEPHEVVDSPEPLVEGYSRATKKGEALYYANVAQVDQAVGRLLKKLDESNYRQSTFALFTSDNGPETLNRYPNAWRSHGSPGPLRGMKLHLYEGGTRVPGILRWPGRVKPGSVINTPIGFVDLLPTLCEAAGVAAPRDRRLDGASFLPALSGKPLNRKQPLYWQYNHALGEMKVAIRDGDWKLLADAALNRFELYNLRTDISEKNDLSAKEPKRLNAMAQVLKDLHADIQKP